MAAAARTDLAAVTAMGEVLEGTGRPLVPAERAGEHFGWIGAFVGADCAASSTATRRLLGWEPARPGLLADLEAGHYVKD